MGKSSELSSSASGDVQAYKQQKAVWLVGWSHETSEAFDAAAAAVGSEHPIEVQPLTPLTVFVVSVGITVFVLSLHCMCSLLVSSCSGSDQCWWPAHRTRASTLHHCRIQASTPWMATVVVVVVVCLTKLPNCVHAREKPLLYYLGSLFCRLFVVCRRLYHSLPQSIH